MFEACDHVTAVWRKTRNELAELLTIQVLWLGRQAGKVVKKVALDSGKEYLREMKSPDSDGI